MLPSREELHAALAGRIGEVKAARLAASRVAVAGLGGLGSNSALALARSGVGQLLLVDFDVVDITNLNRQDYTLADLGVSKVEALTRRIAQVNPYLDVKSQKLRLTKDNAWDVLGGYPIVVEAFDDPEAKAMLVEVLLSRHPGPVLVSASGMAGIGAAHEITTRKINQRWYICGDFRSDNAQFPLTAPRVAVCAGQQASVVLDLLVNEG